MNTEIYLIRHAETFNRNINYIDKNIEKQTINEKQVLSVIGELQAFNLANIEELQKIDVVYSSDYIRAISTAKYIVEKNNCNLFIDEKLGERKLGSEEKTREFWLQQMTDEHAKTIDGESQYEVKKRMLSSLNNILTKHNGKRIAIISHATAITFLLINWCNLENVSLDGKRRKLVFDNHVVIDDSFNTPEIFKLVFHNETLISINRIQI